MNRQNMSGYDDILEATIATNVEAALVEDIGSGDLTASLLPENEVVSAPCDRAGKCRFVRNPLV